MKLRYRKICSSNEGVSEVIGGLMLIVIVATFMTSLVWISIAYVDMQKNLVQGNLDATQRFIDYLNSLYPSVEGNSPPEISDPQPNNVRGILLQPECRVYVSDEDTEYVTVTFFFWGETESSDQVGAQQPPKVVLSNQYTAETYLSADEEGSTYYWQVSVSDGIETVLSDMYQFETIAVGTPGQKPEIVSYSPLDNTPDLEFPVDLEVTICDEDSSTVWVYFGYDPPGMLEGFPTAVTINPATHQGTITKTWDIGDEQNIVYSWYVLITDNIYYVYSDIWRFTLKGYTPPTG